MAVFSCVVLGLAGAFLCVSKILSLFWPTGNLIEDVCFALAGGAVVVACAFWGRNLYREKKALLKRAEELKKYDFFPQRMREDNSDKHFDFEAYLASIGARRVRFRESAEDGKLEYQLTYRAQGLDFELFLCLQSDQHETNIDSFYAESRRKLDVDHRNAHSDTIADVVWGVGRYQSFGLLRSTLSDWQDRSFRDLIVAEAHGAEAIPITRNYFID